MSTSSAPARSVRRTAFGAALLGALVVAPTLAAVRAVAEPGPVPARVDISGIAMTVPFGVADGAAPMASLFSVGCPGAVSPHGIECLLPGTQTSFVSEDDEYDVFGYDRDGYDEDGFDRWGYDREGYDRDGFDEDGFDRDGFDEDGYDEEGYDKFGRDRDGFNRHGYDRWGLDREGYTRQGCRADGMDREWADRAACDAWRVRKPSGSAF